MPPAKPSLAGMLARMDVLKLVRRERPAHDQRRVIVSLNAKRRGLAARTAPQIEAVYAAMEAHIGSDLIGRFHATLDELIGLLHSVPGADHAG